MSLSKWLDYLEWEGASSDAMSAMELDGYIAALAVSPTFSPTSFVRSEIWGTDSPTIRFRSEQHGLDVMDALARYYGFLSVAISQGVHFYSPLCLPGDGEPDLFDVRVWACGFMLGMENDPPYWRRMFAADNTGFLMTPITMFFPDQEGAYKEPRTAVERDGWPIAARTIPTAVCGLWKMLARSPVSTASGAKVGRNVPCPCGSGKKHKQCCGR